MRINREILRFVFSCFLAVAPLTLHSRSFEFSFPVGKSCIDSSYKNNARAYARMEDALHTASESSITIISYSSPDGNFSRNRQLARLRAASARDLVVSLFSSVNPDSMVLKCVNEDWDGVKAYLKRSSLEWKDDALAILNSSEGDKKALLQDLWVGEAWDDLMKNCFPSLRRVSIQIAESAPEVPLASISGCSVQFNQGSSVLVSSYKKGLKQVGSSSESPIYIYVYASPEGDPAQNEKLSYKRASRVEAALRGYGYSGSVEIKYLGEDWNGLLDAVKTSSDLPDKEAVIDILTDTSLDRSARKKALQALSYGKTWLRLMDTEMSGLRRAIVSSAVL